MKITSKPVDKSIDVHETSLILEVKNLQKSFGSNRVLKDLNLILNRGENLVVLGKSGSGKSVLIKCMVGLIEPDDGILTVLGKNIADLNKMELNAVRKRVGFLFQSGALYDSMSVLENLLFPLRDKKEMKWSEKKRLAEEIIKSVGLEGTLDKMPSELSGGMRKRLGLARTLILKPELILYDEPTTGLDPITSKEISELMLDVQKKYQTSSVIITHDMACARITANRIVVLKDGSVEEEGTCKELEKSENKWVRSFFE